MTRRVLATLAAAWTAVSCSPAASSERRGDEAYAAGRYREAVEAYRTAATGDADARIWAKVGAAALRVNDIRGAADAYLRLAGEDPARADEAAEGLEIAARGAERSGDTTTLQTAVAGLRAVAPERIAGRYALALARRPKVDPVDVLALLPAAIAAAPDPQTVDSLLVTYGAALRDSDDCDAAVVIYAAVVRRSREPGLRDPAAAALWECAPPLATPATDSAPDSISVRVP